MTFLAVVTAWQELAAAILGVLIIGVTTLGPKAVSFLSHWLDAHDPSGPEHLEPPDPPHLLPTPDP
jgi:hypothetical protein